MGLSSVQFGDRAMNYNDGAMEIWLRLMLDEIDETARAGTSLPQWMREMQEDWDVVAAEQIGSGGVPPLDEYISDESRRALVLGVAERSLVRLRRYPDPVSKGALNRLCRSHRSHFTHDAGRDGLITTATEFVDMLRNARLKAVAPDHLRPRATRPPGFVHKTWIHVRFRDREMACKEKDLGVWLRALHAEMEQTEDAPDWLQRMQDDCDMVLGCGFDEARSVLDYRTGSVPLMEQVVTDEARRALLLSVAERARERLLALGDPIPVETLNTLRAADPHVTFHADLPAAFFERIARDFTAMLRDARI